MCGLFGWALKEPLARQQQLLTQLAIYNETRGSCSWGAYLSEGDEMYKDVGPIGLDLHTIPTDRPGILIGHTRAATVGDVIKPNCHPFEFEGEGGTVIGAHNGSIGNYKEMNKKYGIDLKVDSMHIFHHWANKLPLDELEGSGAVTFIHDDVLLLSRFNSGVLSVAHLDNGNGIIWSSDEAALKKSMHALGLKFSTYNIINDRIYYYEKGQLFTAQDKMPIKSYVRQTNFQGTNWHEQHNNKHSKRLQKPIVVRLRVLARATIERDDEIEAIKAKIFKDEKLSSFRRYSTLCADCKDSQTTRYRPNGTAVCLDCLAEDVKAGKLEVSA